MRGLDDLVASGKVLYVGISDTPAWMVSMANTLADCRGWTRFVGLQIRYRLLDRAASATCCRWPQLGHGGDAVGRAGRRRADGQV